MAYSPDFCISLGQDSLSSRDWHLQRKGPIDQARHNEKVKESLKSDPETLADILSTKDIITSDGERSIRVPIRSLDLPDFRYGIGQDNFGLGEGETGDVVIQGKDPGGKEAGNRPGGKYYEAQLSQDELLDIVFAGLGLPNLEDRGNQSIDSGNTVWRDIRKKGPMSSLDRRRTFLESIRRNAIEGHGPIFKISSDDLRFKSWETEKKPDKSAVLIAMRDVSGSMGDFERSVTRISCAWMVRWLRRQYPSVNTVFIAHHARAAEVNEASFFQYGDTGGTIMSTAYKLALDIMEQRYPWQNWNIYPFHFTDGANFEGDDQLCAQLATSMLEDHHCNMFGYAEIRDESYLDYLKQKGITDKDMTTLKKTLDRLGNPRIITTIISSFPDISPALINFFHRK